MSNSGSKHKKEHIMDKQTDMVNRVRRDLLKRLLGVTTAVILTPEFLIQTALASDNTAEKNLIGPLVDDVKPEKLTDKVYYIPARQGKFPSVKNKGFFTNIMFIVSDNGVIVIDPSASLQIGRMAIRMIKTVTDKPVIAVINTHYHGDHWMGNHAFVEAYPNLPIYSMKETADAITKVLGEEWIQMALSSTKNATAGTKIVAPNSFIKSGDTLKFGDLSLKIHQFGQCHTPFDLLVEVDGTDIVHMGDVVMDHRLAGMNNGEGSFIKGIETLNKIKAAMPNKRFFPAHGVPGKHLVNEEIELFETIYHTSAAAQKAEKSMTDAVEMIKAKPFMQAYAKQTEDFEHGLGQWVSIAFQEAEAANF